MPGYMSPRHEKVKEAQRIHQRITKPVHLKYPSDKFTSVIIPGALAATLVVLMGRGIYNMANGIGKIE